MVLDNQEENLENLKVYLNILEYMINKIFRIYYKNLGEFSEEENEQISQKLIMFTL